ncbi:Myo2p, partial [Aphelenchoides avenae]
MFVLLSTHLESVLQPTTVAIAPVVYLEMPEDLAKNVQQGGPASMDVKTVTHYDALQVPPLTPVVDTMSIEEFAQRHLKGLALQCRREPIVAPFIPKNTEEDYQEALSIFKLILRYTNDTTMPPSKLALLAKYIIQKGIDNVAQRDEIYVQLVNQTHKNGNPSNVQRVWNLMLNAINSFAPGILVFPMLYRYFEQQPAQLSKLLIQSLLRPLRHADAVRQRTTAPTQLEQIATERRQAPVVLVRCTDGSEFGVEVDAWSTAEEICARVLKQRGIGDSEGWGLMIENESTVLEVSDNQYLFDALSRFEIPSHNDGSFMSYKRMPLDDAGRPSRRPSKAEYDQWITDGAEAQQRSTSVAIPVTRSSGTNDKRSMGQVGQRFRYENGQIIPMAPEKPVELPKDYPDDRDRITMSIPSRIRNTQIPSRNGDVDRFLDEIFDQ